MLINLSNHPSAKWNEYQRSAAIKKYGQITDMSFPDIDPSLSIEEVSSLAASFFNRINKIVDVCCKTSQNHAVHIQGEFTFVFQLVALLKNSGILCLASTSARTVTELDNGEKIVKFQFVRFRKYF